MSDKIQFPERVKMLGRRWGRTDSEELRDLVKNCASYAMTAGYEANAPRPSRADMLIIEGGVSVILHLQTENGRLDISASGRTWRVAVNRINALWEDVLWLTMVKR